ncbi:Acetylornithine aminotransferase (ACOAT) [Durusdinium trenchii]|uniref:acetylornithine transaminase n=1 Tax=Durusdinium trenchii TaxID=1381693 RepID=A0ABP0PQE0_9DINO
MSKPLAASAGNVAGAPTGPSPAVMGTYARQDIVFARGDGAWLETEAGVRYLDFGAGIAVNTLGHAHPRLIAALTEQAGKLWHTSNLYRVAGQEKLAERLVAATFADRVFFCNSGAEACEGAIKAARRHHFANGHPERWRIVTCTGAFHGRTLTTLAAAGNPKYLEGFGPEAPGFDHVPFGDLEAARAAVGPETAAIMLEPVQGEGGVHVGAAEYLQGLRALCDEAGILLVLDEVQTGIGRSGKLFSHERAGVTPDIMAVAKGLGGGFPVGAVLTTEACAMTAGTHGSTFGGNPLAMAVGDAVLDIVLEPGFLENVEQKSQQMRQGLARLQELYPNLVEEVRGQGLLLGIKLKVEPPHVVKAALAERLLVVGAGDNVVRLLPPLNVAEHEISEGLERLERALAAVDQSQT